MTMRPAFGPIALCAAMPATVATASWMARPSIPVWTPPGMYFGTAEVIAEPAVTSRPRP